MNVLNVHEDILLCEDHWNANWEKDFIGSRSWKTVLVIWCFEILSLLKTGRKLGTNNSSNWLTVTDSKIWHLIDKISDLFIARSVNIIFLRRLWKVFRKRLLTVLENYWFHIIYNESTTDAKNVRTYVCL